MWLYPPGGYAHIPASYTITGKPARLKTQRNSWTVFRYTCTEGYEVYYRLLAGITVVGCWAHCRRKFDEALQAIPEKDQPASEAMKGKRYCDALFAVEEKIRNLPFMENCRMQRPAQRSWMSLFLGYALRAAHNHCSGRRRTTPRYMALVVNYLLDAGWRSPTILRAALSLVWAEELPVTGGLIRCWRTYPIPIVSAR